MGVLLIRLLLFPQMMKRQLHVLVKLSVLFLGIRLRVIILGVSAQGKSWVTMGSEGFNLPMCLRVSFLNWSVWSHLNDLSLSSTCIPRLNSDGLWFKVYLTAMVQSEHVMVNAITFPIPQPRRSSRKMFVFFCFLLGCHVLPRSAHERRMVLCEMSMTFMWRFITRISISFSALIERRVLLSKLSL